MYKCTNSDDILLAKMVRIFKHLRSVALKLFKERKNILLGRLEIVLKIISALNCCAARYLVIIISYKAVSILYEPDSVTAGH